MLATIFSLHLLNRTTRNVYLANAGIPLFSQSVFYQVLLLIPIIAIEAYVHRKLLQTTFGKAIWVSLSTNMISTLAGGLLLILPLGAFVGSIFFGSSVPVQPGAFPFLPLEIMVTLIPMFLFSVFVELCVGSLSLRKADSRKVKQSFLIANAFTYAMLEILALTQLVKGYLEGRG